MTHDELLKYLEYLDKEIAKIDQAISSAAATLEEKRRGWVSERVDRGYGLGTSFEELPGDLQRKYNHIRDEYRRSVHGTADVTEGGDIIDKPDSLAARMGKLWGLREDIRKQLEPEKSVTSSDAAAIVSEIETRVADSANRKSEWDMLGMTLKGWLQTKVAIDGFDPAGGRKTAKPPNEVVDKWTTELREMGYRKNDPFSSVANTVRTTCSKLWDEG